MINTQPILFIRNRSNSLFIRLIAGFLCIVLLLASLMIYSISVSKQNVRAEIVKYNTLTLENTRDSYEKHLDQIKKQMYLFFFSEEVQKLQKTPNFSNFPLIVRDISTWVINPYLFIDNIVLYSKQGELVLEKGTSTNATAMFNVFYTSSEYPLDFWRKQFTENYTSRIFPAAHMKNAVFHDPPQMLGEFIPIILKNKDNQDFYMVVFLDANKMYKAFHQSIYNDFIIYNDLGQTIFKTEGQDPYISFDDLQKYGSNEFIRNEKYHFIMTGAGTGYKYVYRVPLERIVSQSRLNITLIVIMAAAIALSILFSFLFAARINNPLKKVIESIRHMNDNMPYRTNIKEFNIISDEIHGNQMMRKQMSFINHLKTIRNHERDTIDLDFTDKPFVFVLFQIQQYKSDSSMQASIQKWLYYMKTFIDSKLKPTFADSLTFQIERDQILSLVFTEQMTELNELLDQMKFVFDHDREYGIVTITITSIYSASIQLTTAYEEVQELVGERLLINETQIIRKRAAIQMAVGFTPDQDKEFEVNLKEGNTAQLIALMERLFARWHTKELTAAVMIRFAESMIGKIQNAISPIYLDAARLELILAKAEDRIQQCSTIQELEQLLLEWVTQTSEAVQGKKEEKYPVASFVIDYINDHLSDEIYLDALAEKLKMSSGYLSSYFKGKTGKNIVDYINETRIAKATTLLADNRIKIHDAAKAVGYQNMTSFNRMFKKYTGVTPSEYRKRMDASS
ncbi:AraC family transcriptional regulator [Paenibacillus sp. HWE-109]|uniref:helix-turn-helix domain-containing protein n=1 Tax=Paenibacillus sp. HWE-109 TaxID=1306526 RepID=UPI001EDD58FA|nr:helix-turn-helix domain-containing protein [Paenibacillus sp. HWE-109]UKS28540.1 AraC family transcriptional regulator [Paenibacillus sp. HWE-109]